MNSRDATFTLIRKMRLLPDLNGKFALDIIGLTEFYVGASELDFEIRKGIERQLQGRVLEVLELRQQLTEAIDRINDMLKGDDGQAWKEAQKFIDRRNAVEQQP